MARLPVSGQGQLFEINRDASREAALDHYLTELRARGASVLYQCSGIQCGRNNVWANQIFQQSRLLGRDGSQDYVAAAVDRKSTRLNSSHVRISYAVFCLKKKNTNQRAHI